MGNLSHTTGKVGIGNNLPSSLEGVLTVQNSNSNTLKASIGDNSINSLNFIQGGGDYMAIGYNLLHTDTASTWNYVGADRASLLRWQNGGFQFWGTATTGTPNTSASLLHLMTINSAGNVGIGTNSPAVALDVNGEARCSTSTTSSSNANTLTTKNYVDNISRIGATISFSMVWQSSYSSQWHGCTKSANSNVITLPSGTWNGYAWKTNSGGSIVTMTNFVDTTSTLTISGAAAAGDYMNVHITRTA